jgi:hypothetical protein
VKINTIRFIAVAAGLLAPAGLAVRGGIEPGAHLDSPGLMARITMPDGGTRTERLNGVGCSISICSRTTIKANVRGGSRVSTLFDHLAAIRNTSEDTAVFVMKDGAEQERTLLKDYRVLYLTDPSGETEKLDLADLKSVEVLAH